MPEWGNVNDAGMIEDGRSRVSPVESMCFSINVEHDSMSEGSTMNRSPTRNAVSSASRVDDSISPAPIGVSADTSPGSTHSASSMANTTYEIR